jgi:hypothetical protein
MDTTIAFILLALFCFIALFSLYYAWQQGQARVRAETELAAERRQSADKLATLQQTAQEAKTVLSDQFKNLANEMGKVADMEQQKQIQNVVIQAMGFTPGFDAYSKQIIVQTPFYKPYQVYGNQKTIDNRANLRMFGGTDNLHQQMIESQYKGN